MKINFITFGDNQGKRGSTRIRVLNLIRVLTTKGITCAFNDETFEGYDIIIFQKTPLTPRIKELIKKARFFGIPIAFDLDDYSDWLMAQLKYFDLIIVSTPLLAKMCIPYHPNVVVVPNTLDVDDITIPLKKENKHKSLVWYGYAQNAYILEKWHIHGVKRISNAKGDIPYDTKRIDRQLQEHDLVVIPQEQNETTLAKTHCRMLKALYLGIPCMVSDMPAYLELAKEVNFPKEFIVSSPEEWTPKLRLFHQGILKFNFDFNQARKTILRLYGPEKIAEQFVSVIERFLSKKIKPLAFVPKRGISSLISVILPISLNINPTIVSLRSLLKQTLFDIEIFLVGDSSSPLLKDYTQKDKRIHIIQDPQMGIENTSENIIHGKYIYFMQAGDELEKNALKRFYVAAEISDADVVKTGSFICEGKTYKVFPDEQCAHLITNIKTVPEFVCLHETHGTNLYRLDFLIQNYLWQPEFQILLDTDFIYRVWSKCQKLFVIPEKFVLCLKENLRRNQRQVSNLAQYHLTAENALEKSNNAILLLIQNQNEIGPCFITLSSIVKNLSTPTTIYVISLVNFSHEVHLDFEDLQTNNASINLLIYPKTKLKDLNLICHILQNWKNSKKLLYVSNSCLALNYLDDFFQIPTNNRGILFQKAENGYLMDTNIILFNVSKWQELFKAYPFSKKDISLDLWNALMYTHTEGLSPLFNYDVNNYLKLSTKTLSEVKILCYGDRQPWKDLSVPFGHLWWQIARHSPFYEEILFQNQKKNSIESKPHPLKKIYKKQEELSSIMNAYIKESLLYLITFGKKAKEHRARVLQLHQQIVNKVDK